MEIYFLPTDNYDPSITDIILIGSIFIPRGRGGRLKAHFLTHYFIRVIIYPALPYII
jgi:hypothetical protein